MSLRKSLKHFSPWSVVIGTMMVLSLTSCYDIGDRDNPLDPGASNYVEPTEPDDDSPSSSSSRHSGFDPESSSSSKKTVSSSSKKTESSSSKSLSSSSVISSSSSSPKTESSSSKKMESSSSSRHSGLDPESSSSKPVSSSSSVLVESSSSVSPASSSSSRHSGPDPESSSSKPVSSSSSVPVVSSSSVSPASSSSQKTVSSSSTKTESSSSKPVSSSSSAPVESSSSVVSSSSNDGEWTCGVSPLVRDGVEYKTVVIKERCWTKENLRYVPKADGNTKCYGGENANCETYGLLYDFEAANLACPTGWRLPSSAEYIEMQDYSGDDMYDAGKHFKATTGWTTENGDDFLEFTALPGGYCDDEDCYGLGSGGYWWTSTEKVKNASHLTLFLNGDGGAFTAEKKMDNDNFASVRCVKIQK